MTSSQAPRRRALTGLVAVAALVLTTLLAGCGGSSKVPTLVMPDVVGQNVGAAEGNVYGELHTSLAYYDLSPGNRDVTNDWVVVATSPSAGEKTPKYKTVYAWAIKASEFAWFKAHPTMPRVPAHATAASLVGPGGAYAAVADLVKLRYEPGKAPKGAKADPADAAPFTPKRGVADDLSLEPQPEWGLRRGLLVAPRAGTIVVGVRAAAGTELRVGQFLVLLVVPKPKPKHVSGSGLKDIDLSGIGSGSSGSSGSGGSGGSSGGSTGGTGGYGGIKIPKIPGCPKSICG